MKIITHSGKFHADDVFAVSTLLMIYPDAEIIRTRDEEQIEAGDIVLDVGGIYDADKNRFDHHQIGGAGERENGIPYSSFGLIWKKFGEKVSGSSTVEERVDKHLVQPTDAGDNGVDTFKSTFPNIKPYIINNVIDSFRPTWKEEDNWDERFHLALNWAKEHLTRIIKIEQDLVESSEIVLKCYEKAEDKRLVIIESEHPLGRESVGGVLSRLPEPIYAVLLTRDKVTWQVLAINKDATTLSLRKTPPASWLGKSGKELDLATGISGGVFCHRTGFICNTNNKESAIKLAHIALNA